MSSRVTALVVGLLVLVVVAGVLAWRLLSAHTPYEQALDVLPRSTLRTTYTDWQDVRRQAKGGGSVDAFLNRAYDLDLINGSGVDESTRALARHYGFSPLDAQWEALGQSRKGQVDVMRLDDDVDLSKVEGRLRGLGYDAPPAGSGKGGTWAGSPELVSRLDADLTPLQQNLVVLPDEHLVLMSDSASYVSAAAATVSGDGRSLLDDDGVASLADAAKQPAAAVQWTGTFACEDLTMGNASDDDQQEGRRLVAAAGGIAPLEGLVMAQQPDRRMIVGLHFETSDQASENLQPRVDLASGQAPGQGGSFRDRFTVTAGDADGNDVVLHLRLRPRQQALSDLSNGPVLFATC